MYRLVLVTIFNALARMLVSLLCFYQAFPIRPRLFVGGGFGFGGPAEAADRPCGASQEQIGSLPSTTFAEVFANPSFLKGQDRCAVCICEFENSDAVRRLPCSHVFHQQCVDKWLVKNRVCPL